MIDRADVKTLKKRHARLKRRAGHLPRNDPIMTDLAEIGHTIFDLDFRQSEEEVDWGVNDDEAAEEIDRLHTAMDRLHKEIILRSQS